MKASVRCRTPQTIPPSLLTQTPLMRLEAWCGAVSFFDQLSTQEDRNCAGVLSALEMEVFQAMASNCRISVATRSLSRRPCPSQTGCPSV